MLKLMCGWLVVLGVIIFGARNMWHAESPQSQPPATTSSDAFPVLTSDDLLLLQQAAPACGAAFEGFLTAGTPEARNQ